MKLYEGLFAFSPEETPDNRKNQLKILEDLLSKFQAEVVHKEEWGKRPLGYSLRKFKEGYFFVIQFRMNPGRLAEFQKALQLQEELIKFMIVAKNPRLEKKPAPKTPEPPKRHSSTQMPAQSASS